MRPVYCPADLSPGEPIEEPDVQHGANTMSLRGTVQDWMQAVTRILGLAARPVRTAQGGGGVVLQPYRGYGSPTEVFLIGRVFRQSQPDNEDRQDTLRAQLRDIGRRIARRSV